MQVVQFGFLQVDKHQWVSKRVLADLISNPESVLLTAEGALDMPRYYALCDTWFKEHLKSVAEEATSSVESVQLSETQDVGTAE